MRTPAKHRRQPERELPFAAQAFNLFGQTGDDPLRIIRERDAARAVAEQAEAYQRKMQRTLAECPGFVTCDPPSGDASTGRVVVQPALTVSAVAWLKRRFHVNDALELTRQIDGIAVAIKPRQPARRGQPRGRVIWAKPEQFEFQGFRQGTP